MNRDIQDDTRDPAQRAQDEADRAALERLYGPKKKEAKGQWGVGIALMILGPLLVLWGVAAHGEPRLIGVGILALLVGVWAFFDGLVRARRAKVEDRERGG